MKYIVGFNRDRDSYQVPAALAEIGALSRLVTDYYDGASALRIRRLSHRSSPYIDRSLARNVPVALGVQILHENAKRFGWSREFPSRRIDSSIASVIADESRRRPGDGLLVYSNYAWMAFQQAVTTRKLLFQYHPGNQIIKEAMSSDELGNFRQWQHEVEEVDPYRTEVERIELELATGVICASNFTARGLLLSGVAPELVSVVPYGCPVPPPIVANDRERVLLFVGQGVQRKGLHLLLEAWRRIRPHGWTLRVVASRLDPAMRDLLDKTPSVVASGAVSSGELTRLYATSSALVLPSLVEGFGLVLGEALANGCTLIASTNTGLTDYELEPPVAYVVAPGRVDPLSAAIEAHMAAFEAGIVDPRENSSHAGKRSWAVFRSKVRDVMEL